MIVGGGGTRKVEGAGKIFKNVNVNKIISWNVRGSNVGRKDKQLRDI